MSGPLNADQLEYAELVSSGTELRLAVVAAWLLCEEPASRDPAAQGHNWLNLLNRSLGRLRGFSGVPIVGWSPAGFAMFASARDAATEACWWLNGFSNYAGVRAAAQQHASDYAQAVAIAQSPWDAGHYGATGADPAGGVGAMLATTMRAYPDTPPRPRHRHLPARAWRWARWWLSLGDYRGRGRRELGLASRPRVTRPVPRSWWRAVRWYDRHAGIGG